MATALFRGIVKAGRFVPDDLPKHGAWLAKLEGRRVVQSIKREQEARTMSQSKYYWAVVVGTICEWSGFDSHAEDDRLRCHDGLKRKHLGEEEIHGVKYALPSRTLSVEEFSAYIDRVVRWAATEGVYVPSADEVTP